MIDRTVRTGHMIFLHVFFGCFQRRLLKVRLSDFFITLKFLDVIGVSTWKCQGVRQLDLCHFQGLSYKQPHSLLSTEY